MSILELQNINAFYGKSHVLFDVSLAVDEGEVVALMGRNGVGKTTTLKTILGLVKAEGKVIFRWREINDLPAYERVKAGISFVPDNGGIFPNLTVFQNLKLSMKQSNKKGIFNIKKIFELFPALEEMQNRRAGTLSGGERRMLGIAKGLLLNPELLIIDEPSEGLAPSIVHSIAEIIIEIRESGVSVLIADQNLPFIEKVADRVYAMDRGEIKMSGKLTELSREKLEEILTF